MTAPDLTPEPTLADLRAVAEAATPGPWRRSTVGDWIGFDDAAGFFRMFERRTWATEADVEHVIRFDPPTVLGLIERVERAEEARDLHFAARNMLGEKADRLEAQLAEVRRTSRVLPCDGLCSTYPEEDCSLHGREPAELWEAIAEKNKHAEAERTRAEAAEAALARTRRAVEHYTAPGWSPHVIWTAEHIGAAMDATAADSRGGQQ